MYYHFLFFFSLFNGLVIIGALLSRKNNRPANILLCVVLIAGLYSEWVRYLKFSGAIDHYPYFLRSAISSNLLLPAALYLYVRSLTVPGFHYTKQHLIHLIPFTTGLLWYLFFLLFVRNPEQWKWPYIHHREWYFIVTMILIIYAGYLIFSFHELYGYRKLVIKHFSKLEGYRLRWLEILLVLFSLPWILGVLELSTAYFIVEKWMVLITSLIIVVIGFFGIRQSTLFSDQAEVGITYEEEQYDGFHPSEQMMRHGGFTLTELSQWGIRLKEFIQNEKPYLNPELHLANLAQAVGLKPYQVSEILNRGLHTTFYELINRYRVSEVTQRLQDPKFDYMNILGVAMECGFNSKSVFNDTFRKFTGKTPSSFRKESSLAS